jgi:hypothetical protein
LAVLPGVIDALPASGLSVALQRNSVL